MEEKKNGAVEELSEGTLDEVAGGKLTSNPKSLFLKCKCGALLPKPKGGDFVRCKCGNLVPVNVTTLGNTARL